MFRKLLVVVVFLVLVAQVATPAAPVAAEEVVEPAPLPGGPMSPVYEGGELVYPLLPSDIGYPISSMGSRKQVFSSLSLSEEGDEEVGCWLPPIDPQTYGDIDSGQVDYVRICSFYNPETDQTVVRGTSIWAGRPDREDGRWQSQRLSVVVNGVRKSSGWTEPEVDGQPILEFVFQGAVEIEGSYELIQETCWNNGGSGDFTWAPEATLTVSADCYTYGYSIETEVGGTLYLTATATSEAGVKTQYTQTVSIEAGSYEEAYGWTLNEFGLYDYKADGYFKGAHGIEKRAHDGGSDVCNAEKPPSCTSVVRSGDSVTITVLIPEAFTVKAVVIRDGENAKILAEAPIIPAGFSGVFIHTFEIPGAEGLELEGLLRFPDGSLEEVPAAACQVLPEKDEPSPFSITARKLGVSGSGADEVIKPWAGVPIQLEVWNGSHWQVLDTQICRGEDALVSWELSAENEGKTFRLCEIIPEGSEGIEVRGPGGVITEPPCSSEFVLSKEIQDFFFVFKNRLPTPESWINFVLVCDRSYDEDDPVCYFVWEVHGEVENSRWTLDHNFMIYASGRYRYFDPETSELSDTPVSIHSYTNLLSSYNRIEGGAYRYYPAEGYTYWKFQDGGSRNFPFWDTGVNYRSETGDLTNHLVGEGHFQTQLVPTWEFNGLLEVSLTACWEIPDGYPHAGETRCNNQKVRVVIVPRGTTESELPGVLQELDPEGARNPFWVPLGSLQNAPAGWNEAWGDHPKAVPPKPFSNEAAKALNWAQPLHYGAIDMGLHLHDCYVENGVEYCVSDTFAQIAYPYQSVNQWTMASYSGTSVGQDGVLYAVGPVLVRKEPLAH